MRVLIIALLCVVLFPLGAGATILWKWSFASEVGYFRTDKTYADTSHAGLFTFLHPASPVTFGVTESAVDGTTNAASTINAFGLQQSFVWDGSSARLFAVVSGAFSDTFSAFLIQNRCGVGVCGYFFRFDTLTDMAVGSVEEYSHLGNVTVIVGQNPLTLEPLDAPDAQIPLPLPIAMLAAAVAGLCLLVYGRRSVAMTTGAGNR